MSGKLSDISEGEKVNLRILYPFKVRMCFFILKNALLWKIRNAIFFVLQSNRSISLDTVPCERA